MSAKHTPGRLVAEELDQDDDFAYVIRQVDGDPYPFHVAYCNCQADARRLVACWNACDGISTEALENITLVGDTLATRFQARDDSEHQISVQRDDLLAALKECVEDSEQAVTDYLQKYGFSYRPERLTAMSETVARARAAIAKAEGGAA